MKPVLVNRCKSHRMPREFLIKLVSKISKDLKKTHRSITQKELVLVFVDAKEMKTINREFRGKNSPTDVLSFSPVEPEAIGELVICPAVLEKQAVETGLTYRQELSYMVIHGCLHLLGYEHETNARDAKKMFQFQDQIFQRLIAKP